MEKSLVKWIPEQLLSLGDFIIIRNQTKMWKELIVPFHKDFSPSGEQLEHRKLAHEL